MVVRTYRGKVMGIRFYCPNGHKLNVKEFLAGQRGICPRCGAKMTIPFESTREPGSKDLPEAEEWERRQKERQQFQEEAEQNSGSSVQINLNNIDPGTSKLEMPKIPQPAQSAQPVQMPQIPTTPRLPDPFEGSPDVVWYVRIEDGQQLGPVNSGTIKTWLAEGRIAASTYVWREGWQDWKKGSEVFESLATFNAFDFKF